MKLFTFLLLSLPAWQAMAQISDEEADDFRPFITTWTVTDDSYTNYEITIPTTGSGYDYTVDWGDETIEDGLTGNASHTYEFAGTYTVSISGDFPRIYFNGTTFPSGTNVYQIQSVDQWGDVEWTSMEAAFRACTNLRLKATDAPDLSRVTNMASMFDQCYLLDGNFSGWDVSNVTNMDNMFNRASNFNEDISGWDVGNVSSMSGMFLGSSFNQDLSNWNVSNVEDMSQMFSGTSSFNQDLSSWDISNVTDMSAMFNTTSAFNQNLTSWDMSNVTDMSWMFYQAYAFDQSLGDWVLNNNVNLLFFAENSGISCVNYSSTLIGWAANNPTVENRTLGANGLQYGTNAEAARQQLIDRGWAITGDSPSGVDCSVNATARMANTSVENLPKELVKFYPNPARHQLNIQLGTGTTVGKIDELVIRSISGKVLKKKTVFSADLASLESKITIDISSLNKGIYILEINGRDTLYQTKFIKK